MRLFVLALLVSFALLFGCPQQAASEPQKNQTAAPPKPVVIQPPLPIEEPNDELTLPDNYTSPITSLKRRVGQVNLSHVGGLKLKVVSYWEPNSTINRTGGFATTVSAVSAYPVFVADDKNEVRATAISLPEDPSKLTIDAASTAAERLWTYGEANQTFGQEQMKMIKALDCYFPLRNHLRENLKKYTLTQVESQLEYARLLADCEEELAGAEEN